MPTGSCHISSQPPSKSHPISAHVHVGGRNGHTHSINYQWLLYNLISIVCEYMATSTAAVGDLAPPHEYS